MHHLSCARSPPEAFRLQRSHSRIALDRQCNDYRLIDTKGSIS